jgi:hypothetical protein
MLGDDGTPIFSQKHSFMTHNLPEKTALLIVVPQ